VQLQAVENKLVWCPKEKRREIDTVSSDVRPAGQRICGAFASIPKDFARAAFQIF
jgi:hypothetical protein